MITAYADYTEAVPHPLPVEGGVTEEEELAAQKGQLAALLDGRRYNESVRDDPAGLSDRLALAASTAAARAQEMLSEVEVGALERRLQYEARERGRRLSTSFPDLAAAGEEADASFLAACWNYRADKSMTGRLFTTPAHLLFSSEHGRFSVAWKDVLSVQKAVELPCAAPHPPHFHCIPRPDIVWDSLLVYCARGRVFAFHCIRGGNLLRAGHEGTLKKLFLACDRAWRAAVNVDALVLERGDYDKRLQAFDYSSDAFLSSAAAAGTGVPLTPPRQQQQQQQPSHPPALGSEAPPASPDLEMRMMVGSPHESLAN